jgi:hypothetical protein
MTRVPIAARPCIQAGAPASLLPMPVWEEGAGGDGAGPGAGVGGGVPGLGGIPGVGGMESEVTCAMLRSR